MSSFSQAPRAPQAAATVLLKRRAARCSLLEFARLQGYEPAAHHLLLINCLERLATGAIRRAMVFMPPGSAKSTYASVLFPPWFLAQPGDGNVIAASHSTELAERFGRKVRGIVQEHGSLLGYDPSAESSAAGRWETSQGREYFAAGVGVGIAGFRSLLNLIDDPFRSRQDADSKLVRDRVWEWYNDDLDTRLVPGGCQALVMTRWHDDDLAGRLLARDGELSPENPAGWVVISLPAIAGANDLLGRREGEYLWEGEYGYADRLREKQKTTDLRSWSALYQQTPAPDTGEYFKREWFIPVETIPDAKNLRLYGASDYAVTEGRGDYTVHGVLGLDADGDPWLVDLWRAKTASDEWVAAFCDLVRKWKPLAWAEETGQIKSGVGPFLEREMRARRAYVVREQFPTRGDKAIRAQSFRGLIATRGLRIPARAPWRADFEHELLRFNAGVHDDQVDCMGLIGQLIDRMVSAPRPKRVEPEVRDPYREISPHPGANDWVML